jgi:signal transduction histidine kinase
MPTAESPQTPGVRKPVRSSRLNGAIALVLLAAAATFDVTKPFDKSWSIFYLLPTMYAGWTLRGRPELAIHISVGVTAFLAPLIFRPDLLWLGTGVYNRVFGVLLGALIVVLLWERRRYVAALQGSNEALELRVRQRTAELESANELLRQEIAVRKKAEADQQRLEDELRQAQKMEAVGRLAGGVAHDFNNLLTVINGESSLLREQLQREAPSFRSVEAIHKAGARAAELTQQLLAFARKQLLQPKVLAANQAIESVVSLLRSRLPESIRLRVDLRPSVEPILADPVQFAQIFLNLASNARDAMPEGGELLIKSEPVTVTGQELTPMFDLAPGPYVRLTVSDTGHGMDAAIAPHAFDPFFTTKEVGKGTGLGLASVYGIVKQSGAHIELASTSSRGTTFIIIWPCATAGA